MDIRATLNASFQQIADQSELITLILGIEAKLRHAKQRVRYKFIPIKIAPQFFRLFAIHNLHTYGPVNDDAITC